VITSQCEQYEVTVYLFIGMGRNPVEITLMSLITNYKHDTSYHGLNGLFLFKSVLPFVSRCHHAEAPWILASAYTFVLCLLAYRPTEGVLLRGPSAKKKAPNNVSSYDASTSSSPCETNPLKE
jgi:hypothetical protein